MNGFERLKEQIKDQEDKALVQTVEYLLTREDREEDYLKDEKTVEGMCKFIKDKANKYMKNGWNYITNEVVYSWAVMYFSLPDLFLGIEHNEINKTKSNAKKLSKSSNTKNNVVSLENVKKEMEKKKEITQLSLFGGVAG